MTKLSKLASELWKEEQISSFRKSGETNKIEQIRDGLKKLVEAHHNGDTGAVISFHEKIDSALHSLVGKEGLRPEEKNGN